MGAQVRGAPALHHGQSPRQGARGPVPGPRRRGRRGLRRLRGRDEAAARDGQEKAARATAISDAAVAATEAPFKTVQACAEMVAWAEALAGRSNKNASSDLEVAALMAVSAAEAAAANVYVNLPSIADQALATDLLERTKLLVDAIDRAAATTRRHVRSGQSREPLPSPRHDGDRRGGAAPAEGRPDRGSDPREGCGRRRGLQGGVRLHAGPHGAGRGSGRAVPCLPEQDFRRLPPGRYQGPPRRAAG